MEPNFSRRMVNLRRISVQRGGASVLAQSLGLSRGRLSQLIGEHPTATISEKLARGFEEQLGLPVGWLDEGETGTESTSTKQRLSSIAIASQSALDHLRQNLLRLMAEHQLSQSELARRTGMHQKAINRLVAPVEEAHSPTLETLQALANGLNTTVAALVSPEFSVAGSKHGEFTASPRLATAIGRLVEDFLVSSPEDKRKLLGAAAEAAERAGSGRRDEA